MVAVPAAQRNMDARSLLRNSYVDFAQAGHCLFALFTATSGGLLAFAFFKAPMIAAARREDEPQKQNRPPRPWWRRPAVVVPMSLLVTIGSVSVGLGRMPGPTAAVVFFITRGMLFLAAVGAAFGPRERRPSWLGAALFGIGYMTLIFRHPDPPNWPHVATDRLLRDIREQFPWIIQEVHEPADVAASNARILKAADMPITMSFPQETPLDDVLKYIRSNTESKEQGLPSGIPIYVDPLGLNAAERTQQSPVVIDLEGVPLRTALYLVLNQMGLTYGVGGGVLVITGVDTEPPCLNLSAFPAAHQDPFLVAGHCLLASLAAGLGGLLAPKVCKWGIAAGVRAANLPGDGPFVGEAVTRPAPTGPTIGLPDQPGPVK